MGNLENAVGSGSYFCYRSASINIRSGNILMSLAYEAMMFARDVHANQRRSYTDEVYVNHLAEVCGIAMTINPSVYQIQSQAYMAICWLHDCMEDQNVPYEYLLGQFGYIVADGVRDLSDLEEGNRATRKQLSRERLAKAPPYIQTIKCADLISNTASIARHDPKFAVLYFEEKKLLLDVLTKAHPKLHSIASSQIN
jgi:guanosine-3',5'-bis(diphosphate) 3'-pyrophosphohydrolase